MKTGWCQTHYHRWWRHGDPLFVTKYRLEVVKYRAAHWRVADKRGKASDLSCDHCYGTAEQWAYNHTDPNELYEEVNGSMCAFSLDVRNYIPLCRECHRAFDTRGEQL